MICEHCKSKRVLLEGRLQHGRHDEGKVYACPKCDIPEKPASPTAKNIIELSRLNFGTKE